MKVLHVITGLGGGGAENALLRLVTNRSEGFSHVVICLSAVGELSKNFESAGIKVYYLNMKAGRFSISAIRRLTQIIKQEPPQVIQTWMYHADFIGGLVAKFKNVPVIWSIRQDSPTIALNGLLTCTIAKLCALLSYFVPKAIICNSNRSIQNHSRFGYSRKKFLFIPNGFEDILSGQENNIQNEITKNAGLKDTDCIVGHVARYHPVKNHLGFIEAFDKVQPSYPSLKAVMVGQNVTFDNAALFFGITDSGKEKLVLLGARKDVASIYRLFDFFVMNSHSEAFPNVVAEAMLRGVPCIVTDVGDAAEIVGQTGWVIQPDNTDSLVVVLNEVLALSNEEKQIRSVAARQRILECYSMKKMVARFEQVWTENIK